MKSFLSLLIFSIALGMLLFVSVRDQNIYFIAGGLKKENYPKLYIASLVFFFVIFLVVISLTIFDGINLL
ncbi:MAG: hypothetical protein ACMZ7B_07715 [Balneola sp.]